MVVDTSALIAVLMSEPDARMIGEVLFAEEDLQIAASSKFEFLMVASGKRVAASMPAGLQKARTLLEEARLEVVPFDDAQSELAYAAFRRFGKGSGHPAKLNFGDCMSYALARALDVPLLYKGQDFAMTDVRAAL